MNSFTRSVPKSPKQRYHDRMGRMASTMEQVRQQHKPSVSMEGSTTGPAPKDEVKCKPGKRAPTKAEREWMDSLVRYGCIACRMDGNGFRAPEVHHILKNGQRIGHLFTLPLCPGHHQSGGKDFPSRHPYKARFERRYGTEMELLERLRAELGVTV